MPKPLKYRNVTRFLSSQGWVLVRQGKGSHEVSGSRDGSDKIVIAHHAEVSAGIVAQLMKKLPNHPAEWK